MNSSTRTNPNRSLSQNFLIDRNILLKIEKTLPDFHKNNVIEIGPGTGIISDIILSKNPAVFTLVEKDSNLARTLSEKYQDRKVTVINSDIRIHSGNYDTCISSVPYHITREILLWITRLSRIQDAYLIVQKEIYEKLTDGSFLAIALYVNSFFNVSSFFNIKSGSFSPKPKVDSSFIRLSRKAEYSADYSDYWKFLTNLASEKNRIVSREFNCNEKKRVSKLSIEEIMKIYADQNIHSY